MNYYERVQRSIDFIETHLKDDISLNEIAKEAYMSLANLYRIFFALVGYPVKEYIRLRRISNAGQDLQRNDKPMVDIAMDYGFGSQESFIKAFKKITGTTPAKYKKNSDQFLFQKVNLLESFFDGTDCELWEQYPDIKVLRELKPAKVAYYRHISPHPEPIAWNVLQNWITKAGLDIEKQSLRYFGFVNPYPTREGVDYGFEVWATIGDDVEVQDDLVQVKFFSGGLYAVTSTTVKDISQTFIRFEEWLNFSKYNIRPGIPSLSEVLDIGVDGENTKLDLYIPVELKKTPAFEINEFQPIQVAYIKKQGLDSEKEATADFFEFIHKYGRLDHQNNYTFYFSYDHYRRWQPDEESWFELSTPHNGYIDNNDPNTKIGKIGGMKYATLTTTARAARGAWQSLIKFVKTSNDYTLGEGGWYEEFVTDPGFKNTNHDMAIKLYLPLKPK